MTRETEKGGDGKEAPLLEIRGLVTTLIREGRRYPVVDGVDLAVDRGETVALVGESGCGKTMTGLSILRLVPEPAVRIEAGVIRLDGEDLLALPETKLRTIRGRRAAMIFQEPAAALNPVMTVGRQVGEVLEIHTGIGRAEARARVVTLFRRVGIPDPGTRADAYPHQLSGGMRQRVLIAMALAMDPDLLIADEPTTALDMTVQAQILDLFDTLKASGGSRSCSSPTIWPWSPGWRIGWSSCMLRRSSRRARKITCSRRPTIPTRRGCWPRSRLSSASVRPGRPESLQGGRGASGCPKFPAWCPNPPVIRRDVGSTRDAPGDSAVRRGGARASRDRSGTACGVPRSIALNIDRGRGDLRSDDP